MTRIADLSLLAAAAALLATLAACGGGGGGEATPAPAPAPPPSPAPAPAPAPPPPAAAASTQGFWSGNVDAQTTASAVFLAEGPAMIVLRSGASTTLVTGTSTTNGAAFTLAGRSYNLGAGGSAPYTSTGTVLSKSTLNFGTASNAPAFTLAYNAAYERPAVLADTAGRWFARFSGGTLTLTLDFAAGGAITGTNTSGCTYSGSVTPHDSVAVYDLSLQEACPAATAVQYTGQATLNDARAVLSVAATSSDGAAATVFQATR